jgi:hypothetical protein
MRAAPSRLMIAPLYLKSPRDLAVRGLVDRIRPTPYDLDSAAVPTTCLR